MLGARGERNEVAEIRELAQLPGGIAVRAAALLRSVGPRHLAALRERQKVNSLDSKRLHQIQQVRLVQAEYSRRGSSIAPSSRQSPPDDIRSGSVYGLAIGQTLRGSLRF